MTTMEKIEYTGLTTTRVVVECTSLLNSSNTRIKVKTDTYNKEWEEENVDLSELGLNTSISSEGAWQ